MENLKPKFDNIINNYLTDLENLKSTKFDTVEEREERVKNAIKQIENIGHYRIQVTVSDNKAPYVQFTIIDQCIWLASRGYKVCGDTGSDYNTYIDNYSEFIMRKPGKQFIYFNPSECGWVGEKNEKKIYFDDVHMYNS